MSNSKKPQNSTIFHIQEVLNIVLTTKYVDKTGSVRVFSVAGLTDRHHI